MLCVYFFRMFWNWTVDCFGVPTQFEIKAFKKRKKYIPILHNQDCHKYEGVSTLIKKIRIKIKKINKENIPLNRQHSY